MFGAEGARPAPAVDVKTLHATIGELTLKNDFSFAPAYAGTNWADANRRITQICPHGRGISVALWFRLRRLRILGPKPWASPANVIARLLLVPRAPTRHSWRCRSGGKYYGPRGVSRNRAQMPAPRSFRDASRMENGAPPGSVAYAHCGRKPRFTRFQAQNLDGKYYWPQGAMQCRAKMTVLRQFLEVLADGKNSLHEPPRGRRPQRSQGSEAPRPARRALGALTSSFFRMMSAADQPDVQAIERRATVLQLNDVIDEHASLGATATRCLASATCFAPNTVAQRDPCRRRVEPVRHLGRQSRRAQIGQPDARLQRSQSHDRVAPNKAIE